MLCSSAAKRLMSMMKTFRKVNSMAPRRKSNSWLKRPRCRWISSGAGQGRASTWDQNERSYEETWKNTTLPWTKYRKQISHETTVRGASLKQSWSFGLRFFYNRRHFTSKSVDKVGNIKQHGLVHIDFQSWKDRIQTRQRTCYQKESMAIAFNSIHKRYNYTRYLHWCLVSNSGAKELTEVKVMRNTSSFSCLLPRCAYLNGEMM